MIFRTNLVVINNTLRWINTCIYKKLIQAVQSQTLTMQVYNTTSNTLFVLTIFKHTKIETLVLIFEPCLYMYVQHIVLFWVYQISNM